MPLYLTPKQDDYNQIPELQVCIAEALYDAEAVLSNPSAFKAEEIRTLRDQIISNLERAWEITGRSEDELTGTMVQISQVVAKQFFSRRAVTMSVTAGAVGVGSVRKPCLGDDRYCDHKTANISLTKSRRTRR